MRLIGYGTVLLTLLILSGCGWRPEPKVVTVTKTIRTEVPIVQHPKRVLLNDGKIYVVSKLNYDKFIEEYEKKNGADSYVALSIKDYENLSLNFAELRRYIEQQKQIIIYYEKAVTPKEKTDGSKKIREK